MTADAGYPALYNFQHIVSRGITPVIAVPKPKKDKETGRRLHDGTYNKDGLPVCIGGRPWNFGNWSGRRAPIPLPARGLLSEEQDGLVALLRRQALRETGRQALRIMGVVHRASDEWKRIFQMRPAVERYFSSGKQSRLLDKHQYLGLERVGLHARMATLSYLLTSWGRLMAGDYANIRRMHIRLPRATQTAELDQA